MVLQYRLVLAVLLPIVQRVLEKVLAELGEKFDAKVIMEKLEPEIRRVFPGEFFDDAAVNICRKIMEKMDEVLAKDETSASIVALVLKGDFSRAAKVLLDLALDAIFK